ncbi:MAG: gfo/Idh/MocA family oxidoreductase [Planctomycetota bacterium]|nr:MAG: gfo/Idh/MocA family oxidoreductase [Planctomycetota bacterium]
MKNSRQNRRQFLSTSGALLMSAPTLASKTVWNRGQKAGSFSKPIGIGIIGMGIRGRNLMHGYFLRDPRIQILAVCDVDRNRRVHYRDEVRKHYENDVCEEFTDYQELLERDDIQAVVIATPDHWHATQCIDAARAGKHIYCEKPLTHTLLEGKRLMEEVKRTDCVFQTGSQQRNEYGHRFVKAVEYVRNGRIGKLLQVHVGVGDPPKACDLPKEEMEPGLDWDRWLGPTPLRPYHSELSPRGVHGHYPRWRAYWDFCGGYLADMGAHHLDIAQWALNADRSGPETILPAPDGDPKRGARLVFPGGVEVVHGGPHGTTFLGTEGLIQVDRDRLSSVPESVLSKPLEEGEERLPRNRNHVEDWLQAMEQGRQPLCDVEVGARTAALCQLLNLSYRYGRKLAWDPEAWQFQPGGGEEAWMDYPRRPQYPLLGERLVESRDSSIKF